MFDVDGFSFENCKRNAHLALDKGFNAPKTTKTGTTIVGVVFDGGVVLGADTRATGGDVVSDKNCQKIHKMAPNMYCCGAGTAADCDKTTNMMAAQLELLRLNAGGRQVRIATATRMLKQYLFRYQGYIGAYLILGGVDFEGPHLMTIYANGCSDKTPFTATGSGMIAAMATLESRWKPNMAEADAKKLVRDAVAAGIFNDMGSGSNVDLCVIRADDKVEYLRGYDVANKKGERTKRYEYPKGTTKLVGQAVCRPVIVESVSVKAMEVDE